MPPGIEHLQRLTATSSHGDVQRHVSAFLEAVLDWSLVTEERTGTGIIDCLPIGPVDRPLPVFVVEYKRGGSATRQELENKPGSRQGDTALEQLVRYMTEERVTLFGLLADASRLIVYSNAGRGTARVVLEVEFDSIDDDDVRSLQSRLPLSTDHEEQLEIRDEADFIALLSETIRSLQEPLLAILREYEPEQMALFDALLPVGISREEFANKTAASLVSKLLLIRAMEDQNDRFGAIINPVVAKSFGSSEFGFIVLAHSAYELASTKFPDVFKADIDVFDWWFPGNMISEDRRRLRGHFEEINTRLFSVLQRLWAYRVSVAQDLMGLAYQQLRPTAEATILGAYFTPPALTEFTIDVLVRYLERGDVVLSPEHLFDAADGEHLAIDVTCGSGTFLVSLAARALRDTRRAPRDTARALVSRIHGVDIDPLAVLMARTQLFAALAEHLQDASRPHIYWQNSLTLFDPPNRQLGLFDDFSAIGTAIREAKRDTEESRDAIGQGRFSFVMGNPPWGRRSQIGKRMRDAGVPEEEVDERLADLVAGGWGDWFQGRDDNLLSPFVEMAYQLLTTHGVMALILDARFMAAEWGERVIERLGAFENVWILDVSGEDEFAYSASYPAIVLAQKAGY